MQAEQETVSKPHAHRVEVCHRDLSGTSDTDKASLKGSISYVWQRCMKAPQKPRYFPSRFCHLCEDTMQHSEQKEMNMTVFQRFTVRFTPIC